ncbi:hypothetical protein TFLX_05196 [Thermoflexales bacterium]|nr:hypothetical protein TFLX_05196 [Thermoflexales bacterium]
MEPTRREFMRQVGVFLITCIASGCEASHTNASLDALRASWLELKNPRLQVHEDTDFSKHLLQQHAEALTTLVKEGVIDSAVAADIQVAFEETVAHIQRSQIMCYNPTAVLVPRQDMLEQAMVLAELAQQTTIDPDTIERASVALARDIAWLDQLRAGQGSNNPEGIQPTPSEIEAARILAELLATTD